MRISRLPVLLALLAVPPLLAPSCPPGSGDTGSKDTADTADPGDTGDSAEDTGLGPDHDGDGWHKAEDCDDANAKVHPGAPERCNGGDDDCDGLVDEADPDVVDAATYCPDADGDGRGDGAGALVSCDHPAGYVTDCSDPNDADPSV